MFVATGMETPRIFACEFCHSTYISESGLRSHYQGRHAAVYHRRGPATSVTDFPARSVSQVNRRMNSRQRRRRRAMEAVLQDSDATAFPQLMCGELGTNDLFGIWNTLTRPLSYAVATQTRAEQSDAASTARPQVEARATQVGNQYSVGPEYPPGQISFWQIGLYARNHPNLSCAQLVERMIVESSYPHMAGPDRRRLYGYVCAAVATEQALVDGILEAMTIAAAEDPSGRQSVIQARAIIADRANRPVSRSTMEWMETPAFEESDPMDDPYL